MTAPKPKQVVIDAFVLACSSSALRDVVGTDALRSVLDFEWRELTAGGGFDLQQVWETFESQPGFDPEVAAASICRFKSWQGQLGLAIELPRALRNLSEAEQRELAERCQVPAAELQRVLRSGPAGAPEQAAAGSKGKAASAAGGKGKGKGKAAGRAPTAGERKSTGAEPRGRRALTARKHPLLAAAMAAVAVATLGFAGYQVYAGLGGGASWKDVPASSIAGELPIADARRLGDQVQARLTDPSWLDGDRPTREDQLERALESLAGRGVTVLFLADGDGAVRATAQLWGKPPQIRVMFR